MWTVLVQAGKATVTLASGGFLGEASSVIEIAGPIVLTAASAVNPSDALKAMSKQGHDVAGTKPSAKASAALKQAGSSQNKSTAERTKKVLDAFKVSPEVQKTVIAASQPPPYRPSFSRVNLNKRDNTKILAVTGLAIGAGALYLAFSE
jgi:hypothetical protein